MTTVFFFFNDTATTEIYTLSLHDALPIYDRSLADAFQLADDVLRQGVQGIAEVINVPGLVNVDFDNLSNTLYTDRKSTRLNSSHDQISYAVFCLKQTIVMKRNYISYATHA